MIGTLGLIGLGLSVAGAGVGVASSVVEEKRKEQDKADLQNRLDERINEENRELRERVDELESIVKKMNTNE